MKTSILRIIFIPLFSLAVLIGESYWIYACIGWNPEPWKISYVDPALLSDSLYRSFYRTILVPEQVRTDNWNVDDDERTAAPADPNIQEWSTYFNNRVPARSLSDLIYRADRSVLDSTLVPMQAGIQLGVQDLIIRVDEWAQKQYPELQGQALVEYLHANGKYWSLDTIMPGPALREVIRKNDVPFLRYMLFAKECEPFVNTGSWDDNPADTAAMQLLLARGITLHNGCPSDYLKLRYAYQLIRLAHYSGNYQKAIDLYDNLMTPNPAQSILRYWGLGHKAGAVKRLGDFVQGNYLFSLTFDSCESRRQLALLDFVVEKNGAVWESTMALAKDNHQKATLWMMRGLKEPKLSLKALQEMYALEPGSPRTASMMLREVQRIEDFLYSDKATKSLEMQKIGGRTVGVWDEEKEEYVDTGVTNIMDEWGALRRRVAPGDSWDTLAYYEHDSVLVEVISGRDYVLAFRRFAMDVARENVVPDPALWYMAAGYIDLMDNDYIQADDCLDEAMRNTRGNTDLEHQIRLLDYIAQVKEGKGIGSDISGHIVQTLQWIRAQQRAHSNTKFDKTMITLGREYLRNGDVPRAILAFDLGKDEKARNALLDITSSDEDLEALDKMLIGTTGTDLDKMLTNGFSLSRDALFDVRGSRFMREGKFREALSMFAKTGTSYWNAPKDSLQGWSGVIWRRFWSSPDTTRHNGSSLVPTNWYQDMDAIDSIGQAIPNARQYTRLSFAQEVVRQLEIAEKNPARKDSAYFKIGNLLFNSPFWAYPDGAWEGSMIYTVNGLIYSPTSWPFNVAGISSRIDSTTHTYIERYGSRKQARDYYMMAMNATANRELAAHCAYLLDLCAKRPQTTLQEMKNANNQDRTGYDMLLTKYRETQFSKRILSQCSTYKYFLTQK